MKFKMIVDNVLKIMFAKFQSDLSKIVEDMLKKKNNIYSKNREN